MVDWDNVKKFESHEKLSDGLKNVGDFSVVTFLDDGNDVPAEILQKVLQKSGQKNIKARDSIVFIVEKEGKKFAVWISATAHSNLGELKEIRTANKNTLIGAKIKVERVSKDDMTAQAFKFEKA